MRLDASILQQFILQQKQRGTLLVIAGTHADIGTHLLIEGTVEIGREASGLLLHDGGISRRHVAVSRNDSSYVIQDLGSTNGTMVNGEALRGQRVLQEGDKIFLGQTIIKFTMVDETEAVYLTQVAQLVGTDDLTGLMSKHRFDAALKECLRAAVSSGAPLAVMMMDMDGLKAVNDRHGHHAGAETIRQVGGIIGRVLQGHGEACRFGGDEFSAYLPGAGREGVLRLAEEIREEVSALRVAWKGTQLVVSISIGVATLAQGGTEMAALLHAADEALYRAKAAGKNRVCE